MKKLLTAVAMTLCLTAAAGNPIAGLMERISPGLSAKIAVELRPDTADYFLLTQRDGRPHIEAANAVSAATGLNYYLTHIAATPLTWDKMTADLPAELPAVEDSVSRRCRLPHRYYLNYCTHSYSMAFWDWERWEREIDWMALHGINMPLAITGSEALWQRVLRRIGYPEDRIADFIAGPGFQAWWLMNNLEGWGGPVSQEYIDRQASLQQQILARMREYGMEPVLPGYCGMLPNDASELLGVATADQGLWCGYTRPSILSPTDSAYSRIADVYYDELRNLYGQGRYFSTDPFHEGGATGNTDLHAAGKSIIDAMKRHNPAAVWVAQGWQENPRSEILDAVGKGDILVLDLQAEVRPMWNTREGGFHGHDWIFCELLNFGGNQGLYGCMTSLTDGFRKALTQSPDLKGVGLTPEGIENNSIMYELLLELPWIADGQLDLKEWTAEYARARYGGRLTNEARRAREILAESVYDCPPALAGQGPHESLFCARPAFGVNTASTWAASKEYYDPSTSVEPAAKLMMHASADYADNPHFLYDYIDIARQAIADRGRKVLKSIDAARAAGDKERFCRESAEFLRLILVQDSLLALHPDFTLEKQIAAARDRGMTEAEKDLNEFNLRVQITTWGHRKASEEGRLHDYSNREWSGLLRDFYYPRWKFWFERQLEGWENPQEAEIDFFSLEEPWSRGRGVSAAPMRRPGESVSAAVGRLLRSALR